MQSRKSAPAKDDKSQDKSGRYKNPEDRAGRNGNVPKLSVEEWTFKTESRGEDDCVQEVKKSSVQRDVS